MNKDDLVSKVAKDKGFTKKDVEIIVNATIDGIADALANNDKVQFIGFGTFEVSERAAREGRNPKTGATMKIDAAKTPKFRPGKKLKDKVKLTGLPTDSRRRNHKK